MPQLNTYPTSLWSAGEFVEDSYQFVSDRQNFVLHVGLYAPADGIRLPVLDDQRRILGDYVVIAG